MLEARLKLASPLLFYNSDKAYVKRVQKQVKEEEGADKEQFTKL
jgi:hypothetical protein